mgnify:CR=1 FL=1
MITPSLKAGLAQLRALADFIDLEVEMLPLFIMSLQNLKAH